MRLIIVAACLAALTAFAKPKKSCEDQCADDQRLCVDVCKDRGAPKIRPHCKMACGEGMKGCVSSCKGKK